MTSRAGMVVPSKVPAQKNLCGETAESDARRDSSLERRKRDFLQNLVKSGFCPGLLSDMRGKAITRSRKKSLAERERLRERYRPKYVRILFVGEAPPASRRFFYRKDSGLYRTIRGAFEKALPRVRDRDFLSITGNCRNSSRGRERNPIFIGRSVARDVLRWFADPLLFPSGRQRG
jgi:hypothetical protein